MADGVGALFDAHARDLYRYLSARAGTAAADDLLGETFLAAFRGRATFDAERGPARAWLFGIASNILRQHHRAKARRDETFERLAGLAAVREDVMDIDQRVDAAAHARRLVPHLRALASVDLDILLMHAWAGLDPSEIAIALDKPAATIRSRLSRLRRALRAAAADSVDESVSATGRPAAPTPTRTVGSASSLRDAFSEEGEPSC